MRRLRKSLAAGALMTVSLTACGGGSAEDFCALDEKFKNLDFTSSQPDELRDAMSQAVDAAPDDIKGDVETVSDAFNQLLDKADELDINLADLQNTDPSQIDPQKMRDLEQLVGELNSDDVQTASKNITDWQAENCDTSS